MTIPIDWILERQHADGGWEAVDCRKWVRLAKLKPIDGEAHPREYLNANTSTWVSLLIKDGVADPRILVTQPHWPSDASPFACLVAETRPPSPMRWASLRHLQDAAANPHGLHAPHEIRCLEGRAASAETVAREASEILFGHAVETSTLNIFPEMRSASNHQLLPHRARFKGLAPVGPDTVRILVRHNT